VYGKVVIFGPNYEKFAEAKALVEAGAAFSVSDAKTFEKTASDLLENDGLLGSKNNTARTFVQENAGATKKIMDYIYANRLLTN
jgi:3-deoxy-D-manno-octulosonic-acid transferase